MERNAPGDMGEMQVGDVVLPAMGVSTQVATVMLPSGVETAMLLEVMFERPGEELPGRVTFAISTPGVPIVKQAIEEYERNLRKYLAGELEPVVIQAEGLG